MPLPITLGQASFALDPAAPLTYVSIPNKPFTSKPAWLSGSSGFSRRGILSHKPSTKL
jgi:hypothetical protein